MWPLQADFLAAGGAPSTSGAEQPSNVLIGDAQSAQFGGHAVQLLEHGLELLPAGGLRQVLASLAPDVLHFYACDGSAAARIWQANVAVPHARRQFLPQAGVWW